MVEHIFCTRDLLLNLNGLFSHFACFPASMSYSLPYLLWYGIYRSDDQKRILKKSSSHAFILQNTKFSLISFWVMKFRSFLVTLGFITKFWILFCFLGFVKTIHNGILLITIFLFCEMIFITFCFTTNNKILINFWVGEILRKWKFVYFSANALEQSSDTFFVSINDSKLNVVHFYFAIIYKKPLLLFCFAK